MRRDYFTCVVLLYIAASLSFVCLFPVYYEYGQIVTREITFLEQMFSIVCAFVAVLFVPILSALNKRKWIMIGSCAYGLLAYLPEMILSKMDASLSGAGANSFAVIEAFFLRAIYSMVNAPYAGVSHFVGDKFALTLPKMILPMSLVCYIAVQLFRFYRNAYIAEQLNPVATQRPTENKASTRKPEILGTVISAPVSSSAPDTATTVVPKVTTEPQPAAPVAPTPAQQPKPAQPQTPPAPIEGNKKMPLSESKVADGNSGKKAQAIPGNTNPAGRNDSVIYIAPTPAPANQAGNETKVIQLAAPAPNKAPAQQTQQAQKPQAPQQPQQPKPQQPQAQKAVPNSQKVAPVIYAPAPNRAAQPQAPQQAPQPKPVQPQQTQQPAQPPKPRTPRRSAPIAIQQDGPKPNTPPKNNP